jgi:hypothetical protein
VLILPTIETTVPPDHAPASRYSEWLSDHVAIRASAQRGNFLLKTTFKGLRRSSSAFGASTPSPQSPIVLLLRRHG